MKLVAYDNYCGDMIVDEDGQWTLVDDAQEVVDGLVAEVERLKGLLAVKVGKDRSVALQMAADIAKKERIPFGSNLAGRHGKGAALDAKKHWGAETGVGWGRSGRSYAIPTKDHNLKTLPLDQIELAVNRFLSHAWEEWHLEFLVTRIGCGLAGYKDEQIAPMFKKAPSNCVLPEEWKEWLQ